MLPSSSHSSSKANSAVTPTTDSIQRHKKPFLKMYKCDLWVFYNSVYSWPFFTLLTAGNVLTSYKGFPVMYRLNRFCMIKLCYCCKNTFACNFSHRTSPGLAKFVSSGRVVCAAVRLVLCKSSLPEFMGSQGELFGPAGLMFRISSSPCTVFPHSEQWGHKEALPEV